jgi:hypothetical protein
MIPMEYICEEKNREVRFEDHLWVGRRRIVDSLDMEACDESEHWSSAQDCSNLCEAIVTIELSVSVVVTMMER